MLFHSLITWLLIEKVLDILRLGLFSTSTHLEVIIDVWHTEIENNFSGRKPNVCLEQKLRTSILLYKEFMYIMYFRL